MNDLTKVVVSGLVALTAGILPAVTSLPSYAATKVSPAMTSRLSAIEEKVNHSGSANPALLEEISALIKENPNSGRAHYLAGQLLLKGGYSDLAEQEFSKADSLEPGNPQATLEKFLLKMEADDIGGAWQQFGYVAKRFPNDPSVLLMRSLILESAGKREQAQIFLEQALKSKQQRLGVATAVADVKLRQGNAADALKYVQKDLAKDPHYLRAQVVAGECLMRLQRHQEGLKYLRSAYEANPLDHNFVNVYATNAYRSGHFVEALEPTLLYLATSTTPPEMSQAKAELKTLIKLVPFGEVSKAIAAADAKVKDTPWEGRLQLALGDVYDSIGKRALAVNCYTRGIELVPTMGRPYYRLAIDYEKDGQYKKALELYERAYTLEPKDEDLKFAFARFWERMRNRKNDIAWQLKDLMR